MDTSRQFTKERKILRMNDFICRQCRVQTTCDEDHICGICKAIGKTAGRETENISWQDLMLSSEMLRDIFLWFKNPKPNTLGLVN